MCERDYISIAADAAKHTMESYDRITVILTATAVILAALGLMFAVASIVLGVFAFLGYNEMRSKAEAAAEKAVQKAIAKYPTIEALRTGIAEEVLAKLNPSEPISLGRASSKQVTSSGAAVPFEIRSYPGEGPKDASDNKPAAEPEPSPNPGPDNPTVPE